MSSIRSSWIRDGMSSDPFVVSISAGGSSSSSLSSSESSSKSSKWTWSGRVLYIIVLALSKADLGKNSSSSNLTFLDFMMSLEMGFQRRHMRLPMYPRSIHFVPRGSGLFPLPITSIGSPWYATHAKGLRCLVMGARLNHDSKGDRFRLFDLVGKRLRMYAAVLMASAQKVVGRFESMSMGLTMSNSVRLRCSTGPFDD